MTITYGSVCSGIEAASVAWHPLGWRASWFAEIEPFPSAVLAHRWPEVPNLGDMTKLARQILVGSITAPDVLVGGTPCQAFSVAGMRQGLDDPRGALTIKYMELADAADLVRTRAGKPASIVVWENVPGVLSDKGNAFGCFLGALVGESDALQPAGGKWTDAGCVYGPTRTAAWRVLDAQYFGLAQRRRRVFVVASARAGFDPCAVLFELDGMRRDSPPRRGQGEEVAGTVAGGARKQGGYSTDDIPLTAPALRAQAQSSHRADSEAYLPVSSFGGGRTSGPIDVAACLVAKGQRIDFEVETFCVHGTQDPILGEELAHALGRNNGQENAVFAIQAGALRTNPESGPDGVGVQADHAYTLEARSEVQAIAFTQNSRSEVRQIAGDGSIIGTLAADAGVQQQNYLAEVSGVRRLIPRECERLQGFPDDYTLIPWRGKPAEECPDGPRYKAIGNSKAIPVVRWIGKRIQAQLDRLT